MTHNFILHTFDYFHNCAFLLLDFVHLYFTDVIEFFQIWHNFLICDFILKMWFNFTAVTLYYFLPHKYLFNLFYYKAKTDFHNSAICQITLTVHTTVFCIVTGCSLAHSIFFVIPRQSVSPLWIVKTCCHFNTPYTLKLLLLPLNLHELSHLRFCNIIMACYDLIVVDNCPLSVMSFQ